MNLDDNFKWIKKNDNNSYQYFWDEISNSTEYVRMIQRKTCDSIRFHLYFTL